MLTNQRRLMCGKPTDSESCCRVANGQPGHIIDEDAVMPKEEMNRDDPYAWKVGFPPDKDVSKWEVCFTIGGVVWHRRKRDESAPGQALRQARDRRAAGEDVVLVTTGKSVLVVPRNASRLLSAAMATERRRKCKKCSAIEQEREVVETTYRRRKEGPPPGDGWAGPIFPHAEVQIYERPRREKFFDCKFVCPNLQQS